MKRSNEDNTISVVQRAIKYYRVPVCKTSIKESLKSHSQYPTLKSVCDVLREWKIDNYPLRYQPEEMSELNAPYIVHFKNGGGQLGFVSDIKDKIVTYYDSYKSKKKINFDEYIESCSGVVILIKPDDRSGEVDFSSNHQKELLNNLILPIILLGFIFFIVFSLLSSLTSNFSIDFAEGLLLFTKIVGIVLSILLLLHEFEIHFPLTDKLCHLSKATNCNKVLNNKASKVFGWISWADVGIIYFAGTLLILIENLDEGRLTLLAILSVLSLPYPIYSIYFQGFIIKKWCPMCLGVQIVLICEFIILLPQFSALNFSILSLSAFIETFMAIGIIYLLVIKILREKAFIEMNNYNYLGLKKNPEIIKTLIFNQKHYEIPVTKNSMIFGGKNSSLEVTVFLSLHCSHCARAFEKITTILESNIKMSFNIVLIASDINILDTIYQLKSLNKEDEVLKLLGEWFNSDPFARNKLSENLCKPEIDNFSNEFSLESLSLYTKCEVIGTPTFFINGYLLPSQYDIEDIKYFSGVFIGKDLIV